MIPTLDLAGALLGAGAAPVGPPPDIDGSAHASSTVQNQTVDLTTTEADDVIVAIVTVNGRSVSGISSPNTTDWAMRVRRSVDDLEVSWIEIWYGKAAAPLSGETITVSTGSSGFITVDAFGVKDADTSQIWDVNGALPDSSVGTGFCDLTTTKANTMLISGYRFQTEANPQAGEGWTRVEVGGFQLAQYMRVTEPQSGTVATIFGGEPFNHNAGVADAIVGL